LLSCSRTMIKIRNIKISVKVRAIPLNNVIKKLQEKNIEHREYLNFVTFKSKFSYVLFKPSKNLTTHINISSIKNKRDIKKSVWFLKYNLAVVVLSLRIDNIVSTKIIGKSINLQEIIRQKVFVNARYNPEHFPGLFVKFNKGTIILFHSGKVVIVGCRTYQDIKWIAHQTDVCLGV